MLNPSQSPKPKKNYVVLEGREGACVRVGARWARVCARAGVCVRARARTGPTCTHAHTRAFPTLKQNVVFFRFWGLDRVELVRLRPDST